MQLFVRKFLDGFPRPRRGFKLESNEVCSKTKATL